MGDTTLLLVRHGATAHTAQGRFSGCTGDDPPLSPTGLRQAGLLAGALRHGGRIDAVASSPVRRARQTAEVLAAALMVPLDVDDDLREIDFGHWEGRTGAEVQRDWPAEVAAWRAGTRPVPPGGESLARVAARVAAARARLVDRHAGGTVLAVSHLYPVRLSVADALAVPYPAVHRMVLEPTGLSEITVAGPETALVRYNDTAHLTPDGSAAAVAAR